MALETEWRPLIGAAGFSAVGAASLLGHGPDSSSDLTSLVVPKRQGGPDTTLPGAEHHTGQPVLGAICLILAAWFARVAAQGK